MIILSQIMTCIQQVKLITKVQFDGITINKVENLNRFMALGKSILELLFASSKNS